MTPKQKYDEAKRLRTENRLRQEMRAQERYDDQDVAEVMLEAVTDALCRIADALERLAPPKAATPPETEAEARARVARGVADLLDPATVAEQLGGGNV